MASDFKMPLDYIDVASRIVEFRTKHPDGSLQQVNLEFREVNDRWWVIYTAAAYRTPEDVRPGIGTAWEPIPGKTNFTRDSEVQNAETAAWGRAIVAALAADTKKGVASADEVRNRQVDRESESRMAEDFRAQAMRLEDAKALRELYGEVQRLGIGGAPLQVDGEPVTLLQFIAQRGKSLTEETAA